MASIRREVPIERSVDDVWNALRDVGHRLVRKVPQVVDHRQKGVARIAAADHVSGVFEVGQAVERRVRLEHTAVSLSAELGVHGLDRFGVALDPAR